MNKIEYIPELKGEAPVVDFEKLILDQEINKSIYLGPFVLETDGAFETEYFYERNKVLEHDYLTGSGGERSVWPILGKKEKNSYYGPAELEWKENMNDWEGMRFISATDGTGVALYATPQRNCVFYVAVYVRCQKEQEAILIHETSGCQVMLNGQIIDQKPYGRIRGEVTTGYQVPVHFRAGINLLMLKVRVGFMADDIDICVKRLSIHPLMAKCGSLGITYPVYTTGWLGDEKQVYQMLYVFAGAFEKEAQGRFSYEAENGHQTIGIGPLQGGETQLLRLEIPVREEVRTAAIQAELECDKSPTVSFSFDAEIQPYSYFPGTKHLMSGFHFDTTYHEEQRSYAMGAFYIASRYMERLRRDPDSKLIMSEVDYLHPFYSLYPENRQLLREAFESGRVEADCFYNQPNELNLSAEALTRNLIYGQKYHMEYFGQKQMVFSPNDVYGHPNQMSQLCAKGECISCRWVKPMMGLDCAFYHMSPDGSKILHTKPHITREDAKRLHLTNYETDVDFNPGAMPLYTTDDGMPWKKGCAAHTQYSVPSELQNGVEADNCRWKEKTGRDALQTVSGNMTQHHLGTLLTRSDFKQANRLAENLLISAEKFATFAAMYGAVYPERILDKAWRQLLCAQHHDSVTGTNNEISYIDLMLEYRETVELAELVLHKSMEALAEHISPAVKKAEDGGYGVTVFNPHPWKRREPCVVALPNEGEWSAKDADGCEYPLIPLPHTVDGTPQAVFLPEAPSLGYRAYTISPKDKQPMEIQDRGCMIENEYFRLTVDPRQGGGIISLWDKKAEREVILAENDGPANRIVVLREMPERLEGQHEFYTTGHKLYSSDYQGNITRTRNAVFEQLVILVNLGSVARARQTVTLWRGVPRVDMKVIIEDYQGRDDLFTVTFPVNVKNGRTVFDDRFAPHVTGKSHGKLSFQTHQQLNYSQSHVVPVNQWIELGPTVAVELDGKGVIQAGMTALIRNENGMALDAADRLLAALTKKAIPVTLYPEGEQHGKLKYIHFQEDLMNTDMRIVVQMADEEESDYAAMLRTKLGRKENAEFEQVMHTEGLAILYYVDSENMLGKAIDVLLVYARDMKSLDLWTDSICEQLSGGHRLQLFHVFCASACPQEDDYGVALLNNGNQACSVEGDRMLNMMLFHTADFYGNRGRVTGDEQLIPEQKTYMASYALYPHAHSYREAGVYRKAMEFNDPLMGVLKQRTFDTFFELPAEKSFLHCSDQFLLTCFKPGGFDMAGMSQKQRSIWERGITVRGFETDGRNVSAEFTTGFEIAGVRRVNLMEHGEEMLEAEEKQFWTSVEGHSIETYMLTPVIPEPFLTGSILEEKEPVQPVYVRSWEHDRGSMPIGYLAVAGVIGRKAERISPTEMILPISMANNQPDEKAAGMIRLSVSDGITCSMTEIPYELPPHGFASWEVRLKKETPDTTGCLRMQYEDAGQCFQDIFEIGYFEPEMKLEDLGDHLRVSINNKTREYLSGELELASPIETWYSRYNPHAIGSLPLGQVKIELAPGEKKSIDFPWTAPSDDMQRSFWAVAKLMVHGHICFAYIHRKGKPHYYNSVEMTRSISEDHGSVRQLYEIYNGLK